MTEPVTEATPQLDTAEPSQPAPAPEAATTAATEQPAVAAAESADAAGDARQAEAAASSSDPVNAKSATAEEDARALKSAFGFFGTKASTLINILGRRTPAQLSLVRLAFLRLTGSELTAKLSERVSGVFGEALLAATRSPLSYDAELVRSASASTAARKEGVLADVLTRRDPGDIAALKSLYHALFGQSLEDVVRDVYEKDVGAQRLMLSQIAGTTSSVARDVNADAQTLHAAAGAKFAADKTGDDWLDVLAHGSSDHLRQVFAAFKTLHGNKDFQDVVKKETSGEFERVLMAVIGKAQSLPTYIAENLEGAMKGIGSNKRAMIRYCVRYRGDVMEAAKEAWTQKFGGGTKTLRSRIEGESSGDLRRFLIALIRAD